MAISPITWGTQEAHLRPQMEVVYGLLEGLMTSVAVPRIRGAADEKELRHWKDISEQTLITLALRHPNITLPMDRIEKVFSMLSDREGAVTRYLGVCATGKRPLISHVFAVDSATSHELLVCKFVGDSNVLEIVRDMNRGDLAVVDIMKRGLEI